MDLFVFGTSHLVASRSIRERMHVDPEGVRSALLTLVLERGVLSEAMVLSTCGRLELYGVAPSPDRAIETLGRLMARRSRLSRARLSRHVYVHRGREAARHLFRVAAGLDSAVYGEAQILGQVRDAAHHPSTAETGGPVTRRLFQNALAAGKRVRSETEIGRGAASLAGASLRMIRQEIGALEHTSVLVLGAGDTGALMTRLLAKAGVRRLVVANRSVGRARHVAEELGAESCSLEEVPARLRDVDVVVVAAASEEYLITPETLCGCGPGAGPRCFVDLAHPRSVDPAIAELEGVTVLDLEDVFGRVEASRLARAAQVPMAEALVEQEVESYTGWLRLRENAGVVRALRSHVLERALEEAERYAGRVPEEQREHLRRLARSIARSILHRPTVALRDADPASEEGRSLLRHGPALFGLADNPPSVEA